MNAKRILLTVGIIMSTAATATADYLVVLNKSDHEACLVDPASHKVLTKLPTGLGPHEVAVSPNGRFAYALVPRHKRRRGHPLALSPALARSVAADATAVDLSDAVRRNARLLGYLDVTDAGVTRNRNTPRD